MSRDIGRCLQELLGCVYLAAKRCDFSVDLQQSHRIHGTCYGEQDIARSELVVLEYLRMFITT
jgi:hypothetical protein